MTKHDKTKKIVTIGGGTGSFVVLSGLKKYKDLDLTAIVSMADDGGSTGILRDEYGVLPPGDIRQCLVALSEADKTMRDLFNFRFGDGSFKGHSFGNIFISTIEKMTGNFNDSLEMISGILKVRGKVVPVTLDKVNLVASLNNGQKISGQYKIADTDLISRGDIKKMSFDKKAKANPKAIEAILAADMIIVGPGHFHTSLIPNFLVCGIPEALLKSKAKKVFICNLMNKHGQTQGMSVSDLVEKLESFIGPNTFDFVIYNNKYPPSKLLKKYKDEGLPVLNDGRFTNYKLVESNLLSDEVFEPTKGDPIKRTLIRHDPDKLVALLMSVL